MPQLEDIGTGEPLRSVIEKGYFGFVSLQPKTKLIEWYQQKYGFRQYGRLLGVEQASSNALIKTYLLDENE